MFISFIVATYNCVNRVPILFRTIKELQGLPCEFCVSDGGSTDGTTELLKAEAGIRVVCSAPDRGIYDAWNRALRHCTGQYISFIGIDDEPSRQFIQTALEKFSNTENRPAIIYGNINLKYKNLFRLVSAPEHPALFTNDRPFFDIPHPGCLNHFSLFQKRNFCAEYKLAGDLDFYLRARWDIKEKGYTRLDELQAVVDADGLSRSAAAFSIYQREYAQIQATLGVQLGYSLPRLRIMGLLSRTPRVFKLIKRISWAMRGRVEINK